MAIDHFRYVLVALRHGAKFRGEARLALFLLPPCGFPVVCCSQEFSRALSQNKKTDLLSAGPAPGAALRILHARPLDACAGKATRRYGLGSRLTVAGRHFLHLFALLSAALVMMIASSSSLSSSFFLASSIRVLVLELPSLRPKTRSCSRERDAFFFFAPLAVGLWAPQTITAP